MNPKRWRAAVGMVLLLVAGCAREASSPGAGNALETLEVSAGVGGEIQPDRDEQAEVGAQFAGALPGDFPEDLPVYTPSSLVDYGDLASGSRFVLLLTRSSASEIDMQLSRDLAAQGWQLFAEEASGRAYRKGLQIVRIRYEESGPETLIRIEYPPPG